MKTPYPEEFLVLVGQYGIAGILEMLASQTEQASDVWINLNRPQKSSAWKEVAALLEQAKEKARQAEVKQ